MIGSIALMEVEASGEILEIIFPLVLILKGAFLRATFGVKAPLKIEEFFLEVLKNASCPLADCPIS